MTTLSTLPTTAPGRYARDILPDLLRNLADANARRLADDPLPITLNSIANLRADYAKRNPDGHWFDRDSMRFFRTRFAGPVIAVPSHRVTLFVTTEQPPEGERKASVRAYMWETACIATPGGFCEATIYGASEAARIVADALAGYTLYRVKGQDRALNALGVLEPFEVSHYAADAKTAVEEVMRSRSQYREHQSYVSASEVR